MEEKSQQNIIVMRHGDRIDASEPLWTVHSDRPWDPPLTEGGKIRSWSTGKKLRATVHSFPIHRVIVSPFLRCLQTANEVVRALCAVVDDESDLLLMESSHDVTTIDPSRVKVHIELGLCEVMCSQAMRIDEPAKEHKWFPDISELESIFPAETLDRTAERIYHRLPQWEEPVDDARKRYEDVIVALANKYPHENLLLVTHGEAVGVSISSFAKGLEVFDVEYCALSYLLRIITDDDSQACTVESFEMLTENTKTGVCYYSTMEKNEEEPIES